MYYQIPVEFIRLTVNGLFGLSLERWMLVAVAGIITMMTTNNPILAVILAVIMYILQVITYEGVALLVIVGSILRFVFRSALGGRTLFINPHIEAVSDTTPSKGIWIELPDGTVVFGDGK